MKVQVPNHWTTREFPSVILFFDAIAIWGEPSQAGVRVAAALDTLLLSTISPSRKQGQCLSWCSVVNIVGYRSPRVLVEESGRGGHQLGPRAPSVGLISPPHSLQELLPGKWDVPGAGSPLLQSAGRFVGTLSPLATTGRFCFTVGLESGRGSCRCAGREPPALNRPGPLPLDSWVGGGKHPPSFLRRLGEARGQWGPGQHSQGGAAISLMLLHFRSANLGWE